MRCRARCCAPKNEPLQTINSLSLRSVIEITIQLKEGEIPLNKYRKLLLNAMRFCSIVFSTILVAALAGAQTSAQTLANDERSDARDAPTPVLPPICANSTGPNFDKGVIKEFVKAWNLSQDGLNTCEAVVLIFRMEGGGYTGGSPGFTNEYRQSTFEWNPAAVAIVHTHPNSSDPRPSEQDRRVADKYGVPIFTITISGMYMYNPATKKISKVLKGLDWLDPINLSLWAQEMDRGVDTSVYRVFESRCK